MTITLESLYRSEQKFDICPQGLTMKNSFLFKTALFLTLSHSLFGQTKICLTMIVKNESAIIERCLDSVKNKVDLISICDTGSTDNTVEVIEKFLQKNKIPGKVYQHSWSNFGHNRTLSAKAAQQTIEELKFLPEETYLLFLDADMVLNWGDNFNKASLVSDGYLIQQTSHACSNYNLRLAKSSLPWESKGVTHEYWTCNHPHQIEKLSSLTIDDREDGGCKADKFERDLRLLTEGLRQEPENERYLFYCAQTNKSLKKYDEAIRLYKARIAKGGWIEEVWFSKFMIGECYDEMGFWDHAMHWYLDAYDYNPQRAEPLQKIARHYRLNGINHLAYLFAKHAKTIPRPQDQLLFISDAVYDYQFDEELSIAAFYTPFKEEGFAAANRLLLKKNIPQTVKEMAANNILFYIQNLKGATFQSIRMDLPPLHEGSEETYLPMNPTIQKTKEGYTLICRTVNWSQNKGRDYKSRDPLDPTIRTRNFLLSYDKDFQLLSQKEMIENVKSEKNNSLVQGLEDCRLVHFDHDDWFICATYDPTMAISQTLCKIGKKSPIENSVSIQKCIPLKEKGMNFRCEKNWLPFCHKNDLLAIYSYDPFVILKIKKETGECERLFENKFLPCFSSFRGSAGPIAFDQGFLLLVHEVTFNEGRLYTHRFVALDQDFQITKVSKPFTFLHQGIEYCCGMTLDHSGKNCVLAVGIEDREALLCTVSLENIQKMLEPKDSLN